MRLRTRLLLAFAYVLATVVVALEVPLAVSLNRRALAEQKGQALAQAQALAGSIRVQDLVERGRDDLQRAVEELAVRGAGRVIVTDAAGRLLADSAGEGRIGLSYESRPEIQQVLQPGASSVQVVRFSDELGQQILATAVAVREGGRVIGAVRMTQGLDAVRAEVRRIVLGLAAIGLAVLAAGVAIAWVLAGSLSRPLGRLAAAAHRLGEGDLSVRSGVTGPGEIGEVAETFDAMAGRIQALVRAEQEFVANASHQLRTPLTALRLRLEAARAKAMSDDVGRELEAAESEVARLSATVDRLLVLARSGGAGRRPSIVDLGEAAGEAVARWQDAARATGREVSASGRAPAVAAARVDVDQIADNLIDNALRHAMRSVAVEVGGSDGSGFLAVEDDGPGIPAGERDVVLQRFYRGRSEGGAAGSGLGLAIVAELARHWGGEVRIEDAPAGGARVEVRFPVARGAAGSPA